MNPRLGNDDCRAVDRLLDNDAAAHGRAVDAASLHPRMRAAGRLLDLLRHLPAGEPSADLTQRTLQKVDGSQVIAGQMQAGERPVIR